MVRLLRNRPQQPIRPVPWFQSHNGAIAATFAAFEVSASKFVSIPQWCDCCLQQISQHFVNSVGFNPTMVRLLPSGTLISVHAFGVSIPQWCDCCWESGTDGSSKVYCFNPTMVRLLRGDFSGRQSDIDSFQSHNGAIAAIPLARKPYDQSRFQSHNGAIAAVIFCENCENFAVSIPQWCDCCTFWVRAHCCVAISFNPTMVRLLLGKKK